jgi:hypothetical protein
VHDSLSGASIETRLSVGFGLTGFWFGASVDYGLEKTSDEHKAAARSRLHDAL